MCWAFGGGGGLTGGRARARPQVLAVVLTSAVSALAAGAVFMLLRKAGMLRVDQATELAGE